jgi:hypothetical protein
VVLALKRVVKAGENKFQEVVYTPYTKELNISELRQAGMKYLREKIDTAETDLRQKGVQSRAYGGLVSDVVPVDVALVLSVIEHMDPARFQNKTQVEQLVNEVLVIIGANEKRAYRYAVSKARARGLSQFIPRTYKSIRNKYPKARLDPDFVAGMNDHLNGAKASLLLFDCDLSSTAKDRRIFLKNNPKIMGKYLAATYNGGVGNAAKAIDRYGNDWEKHVRPETVVYLQKFDAVWSIFHS